MNLKEKLNVLKEKAKKLANANENKIVQQEPELPSLVMPVNLDDKVDEFIKWCDKENLGFGIKMKNFIEKMAVWYELRYPECEINKCIPYTYTYDKKFGNINEVMFKNNKYLNDIIEENSIIKDLNWKDFYNTKAFIDSLSEDERILFLRPRYSCLVRWDRYVLSGAHLHLTRNGFVSESEDMFIVVPKLVDKDLEGKHIKEVVKLIQDLGYDFPKNNEFLPAIKWYENWVYQKEEMLNCVMYRLIQRNIDRVGARRAFIFAKEFNRNIDIPMSYGVYLNDPGLKLFINEYLKAGGKQDLVCYIDYYDYTNNKYQQCRTLKIEQLIKHTNGNKGYLNTPEEKELHQKLVTVLTNLIDQDELSKAEEELRQENVKKLRLQRKIEKSKNNTK